MMNEDFLITDLIISRTQSYLQKDKEKSYNAAVGNIENLKDLPLKYSLQSVFFNDTTRNAKIIFECVKHYKTIVKYITKNYVRTPIYSEWKEKTTCLNRSIRLTNLNLENLNINEDELIGNFAAEIILEINNVELYPSWLIKKMIYIDCNCDIKEQKEIEKEAGEKYNEILNNNKIDKIKAENEKSKINNTIVRIYKKFKKCELKINKIDHYRKSILLTICTLGIYVALNSKSQKIRLENRKIKIEERLAEINKALIECGNKIVRIDNCIDEINHEYEKLLISTDDAIQTIKENFNIHFNRIISLDCIVKERVDFIPLKSLMGVEYEKLMGCYIIHNIEVDKYYVGQSKDIIKRMKQHFKGTEPTKSILSKDYFLSNTEDKSKIFEVKIIRLETKDELDRTEMALIDEYDARLNGYNSTRGNT